MKNITRNLHTWRHIVFVVFAMPISKNVIRIVKRDCLYAAMYIARWNTDDLHLLAVLQLAIYRIYSTEHCSV
jgi:hypothetical protein